MSCVAMPPPLRGGVVRCGTPPVAHTQLHQTTHRAPVHDARARACSSRAHTLLYVGTESILRIFHNVN
jgi:hypothetical protein